MHAVKSDKERTPDEYSEVREIIDSSLAKLKEWLDWRLQQQEDLMRSLGHFPESRTQSVGDFQVSKKMSAAMAPVGSVKRDAYVVSRDGPLSSDLASTLQNASDIVAAPSHADLADGEILEAMDPVLAAERHRTSQDQLWLSNLMGLFDQLDLDRTGSIDISELNEAFREVGMEDLQALTVFNSIDTSNNGAIDRVEWLHIISESSRANDHDFELLQEFLRRISDLQRQRGAIYATDHSRKLFCIVRHDSVFRMAWDIGMIVLLFYVSLSVPYSVGFGESKLLNIFDRISDAIFCCDVALNFRTTFLDRDDSLVVSSTRIARRYLKSWFAIDFLSSIPLDLITAGLLPDLTPARLIKIGKIAKVLRMLRISKLIAIIAESELLDRVDHHLSGRPFERAWRMFKLATIALIVAHWLACFGAAVDGSLSSSTELPGRLQRYIAGVYWAMTTLSTVGYGDITPQSDGGRVYAVAAMVVGGSLYGYVIGSVTSIVTDIDVQAHAYHERIALIQSWLDRHDEIPVVLRRRVRKHFKKALAAKSVIDDGAVVNQLSPELRGDVASFLLHVNVRCHAMFTNLTKSGLAELVHVLQVTIATVHEYIVKSGDPGRGMYILTRGLSRYDHGLKWTPPNAPKISKKFQHVIEGDGFGEEILFGLSETYTYTIITITDCEFHWISKDRFREHFQNMPDLRYKMFSAIVNGNHGDPDHEEEANMRSSNVDTRSSNVDTEDSKDEFSSMHSKDHELQEAEPRQALRSSVLPAENVFFPTEKEQFVDKLRSAAT